MAQIARMEEKTSRKDAKAQGGAKGEEVMGLDELRIALAARAPEVPYWFEVEVPERPGVNAIHEGMKWVIERDKRRLAEWPWAYADMVLAAREE